MSLRPLVLNTMEGNEIYLAEIDGRPLIYLDQHLNNDNLLCLIHVFCASLLMDVVILVKLPHPPKC